MTQTTKKYDLENRTVIFSENIISFCRNIQQDTITRPLVSQLVRSATSVGANYCEANGASSKKDFKNKIYICKKEAKETKYWLQIISKAVPEISEIAKKHWQEAQELTLIFSKITQTIENQTK